MNISEKSSSLGSWFLGSFDCAVDGQRRIALPSHWRESDGRQSHFFLLPGRDESLQLVPAETFVELLQQLRKVSFANRQAAIALATIGGQAQECKCDRQGRFTINAQLLAHAELDERAKLIGSVTTIQIWKPENWEKRSIESDAGLDVIQGIQERSADIGEILRRATHN